MPSIEITSRESSVLPNAFPRAFVRAQTRAENARLKFQVVLTSLATITTWPTGDVRANFPMALDEANHRLFIGTRSPAKLLVLDSDTGKQVTSLDSSGDADDIFYDPENKRIYVSGGEGAVSVFEQTDPDTYKPNGRADTAKGARTSLFAPDSGTLYVAVPHNGSQQAEVRALQTEQ